MSTRTTTKKSPAKKPVRKTTAKKPGATKSAKTRKTTTRKKTTTTKKASVKKSSSKKSGVTLPNNMSQRAITKSLTMQAHLLRLGQSAGFAIAALCIGSGVAGTVVRGVGVGGDTQSAIVCTAGDCNVASSQVAAVSLTQPDTATVIAFTTIILGSLLFVLASSLKVPGEPDVQK